MVNQGALPSRRNVNNSQTTVGSRRLVSSALNIRSQQNVARPIPAPKRRRTDNRPSLTTYLSNNEATSVSTQQSVTSAVIVSIEMVDNRDEESQKDIQIAEQIVLDDVRQREKRK